MTAETTPIQESRGADEEAFNLSRAVLEKLQAHRNIDFLSSPYGLSRIIREPSVLADAIAPLLSAEIDKRQELLETSDVVTRLEKIIALMKRTGNRLSSLLNLKTAVLRTALCAICGPGFVNSSRAANSFSRGLASVRGRREGRHLMGFEEDRSANLVCAWFVPSAWIAA